MGGGGGVGFQISYRLVIFDMHRFLNQVNFVDFSGREDSPTRGATGGQHGKGRDYGARGRSGRVAQTHGPGGRIKEKQKSSGGWCLMLHTFLFYH